MNASPAPLGIGHDQIDANRCIEDVSVPESEPPVRAERVMVTTANWQFKFAVGL